MLEQKKEIKIKQINIKSLRQTCQACPSQWEGHLEDGRMIYIRYRWGYLSVRLSETPTNDVFDAVDGKEILGINVGNSLDGEISLDKVLQAMNENELDL